MTMKFHGSFAGLRQLLDQHDIHGSWETEPNGVFLMRSTDGAMLHWASGGKTLWCNGKPAAAARLMADIAAILHTLPPHVASTLSPARQH